MLESTCHRPQPAHILIINFHIHIHSSALLLSFSENPKGIDGNNRPKNCLKMLPSGQSSGELTRSNISSATDKENEEHDGCSGFKFVQITSLLPNTDATIVTTFVSLSFGAKRDTNKDFVLG